MMTQAQIDTEMASDQMLAIRNALASGKLAIEQLPTLIARIEAGEGRARLTAEAARLVVADLQAMLPQVEPVVEPATEQPEPVAEQAPEKLEVADGDMTATGKVWERGSHKRVYWSFARAGITQNGIKACWDCVSGKWIEKKNIKFFAGMMPAIEAASKAA